MRHGAFHYSRMSRCRFLTDNASKIYKAYHNDFSHIQYFSISPHFFVDEYEMPALKPAFAVMPLISRDIPSSPVLIAGFHVVLAFKLLDYIVFGGLL